MPRRKHDPTVMAMDTSHTQSTTVPTLLKLTLVPPILVVVGIALFALAWDSDSEFMAVVSVLIVLTGWLATIPALLIATYAARRLATITWPELLTIGLAVVGNGGVIIATAKAFEWV